MNVSELLDMLKECHDSFDDLFARIITLDSNFFPSKSKHWSLMQRMTKVLRETGRLE